MRRGFWNRAMAMGWVMLALLPAVGGRAVAAPPQLDYQGKLTDATGNPVNGSTSMVFRIWSDANKFATVMWIETQAVVQVENGLFHVVLGDVVPLPPNLFDVDGRVLSVQVGSDAQMTPRLPLQSVPYALNAERADSAASADNATYAASSGTDNDWIIAGSDIYRTAGNVGIGTAAAPAVPFQVHRGSGELQALFSAAAGNATLGISGVSMAMIDLQQSGVSRAQIGTSGNILFLDSGGRVYVNGGKLGVGTATPQFALDVDPGSARVSDNLNVGGNLGVGTTNPLAKVHVEGTLRVDQRIQADDAGGLEFATSNGTVQMQLSNAGNVGIGTTNPAAQLHVYKAAGDVRARIESESGDADLIVDNASGNPTVEFQRNGVYGAGVGYDPVNDYAFLYHNGSLIFKNGRLGIGTNNPSTSLEVRGDVKVTGQCQGTFPRPNYDSGWVLLDTDGGSQDGAAILTHGLGGDVDNYVVDIVAKDIQDIGINNLAIGTYPAAGDGRGFYFRNLTTSTISIMRESQDYSADYVRVRIWVYN